MPGDSRCDRGDYARVLLSFRTRGCGCFGRPVFPAPSDFSGAGRQQNSRGLRGEIAKLCLNYFSLAPLGGEGRGEGDSTRVRGLSRVPLTRSQDARDPAGGRGKDGYARQSICFAKKMDARVKPAHDSGGCRRLTSINRSNAGSAECRPAASGSRAVCWRGPRRASGLHAQSPRRPSAGRYKAASGDENHRRHGSQR
jgi:hypothetical protein